MFGLARPHVLWFSDLEAISLRDGRCFSFTLITCFSRNSWEIGWVLGVLGIRSTFTCPMNK